MSINHSGITRRRRSSSLLLLIATTCLCLLKIQFVTSIHHPLMYKIRHKYTECIYKQFDKGDFATFEMFVVDSDEDGYPYANVQIDGPVISPKIGTINPDTGERTWPVDEKDKEAEKEDVHWKRTNTLGAQMKKSIDLWPDFVRKNHKHFQDAGIIHHEVYVDYTYSGEEEDALAAQADYSREYNEEIEAKKQRNLEREKRREAGEVNGDENVEEEIYEEETYVKTVVPTEIEPWEWTKPIKSAGWYRLCVFAEDNDLTVELDIRSGAELGGINRETGHVYTFDEREDLDEEERILNSQPSAEEVEAKIVMEELEKALKDQVDGYDLEAMKKLTNEVNHLVNQLQKKQSSVHKRMKSHEQDARRNYKKIIRNGMIQTVLFLVITLFQLYTIHKWLLSNNMLGK